MLRMLRVSLRSTAMVMASMHYERDKAGKAAFFVQPTPDTPISGGFDNFDIIPIEGGMRGWRKLAAHGDYITTQHGRAPQDVRFRRAVAT